MKLPAFFAHIPSPAYVFRIVDGDYVLDEVNLAASKHNPIIATFCGKKMARLYADQPQILEDARRCVDENRTIIRETSLRRHDRTEATSTLRITFVPILPGRLLLFTEDLSTPKMTALAVRESEARYRSLIATLPNAMILRGADGRVLACNDIAARLFGVEHQADLLGRRTFVPHGGRVLTKAGTPMTEDEYPGLRAIATGEVVSGVLLALETTKETRWLLVGAAPVTSDDGSVTGSVTSYVDLSDIMSVQRELRQSASRLDLALSAGRMGVWEFSPGADLGWWSPNLDEIFQFPRSDVGFASFLQHVHHDDRAGLMASSAELTKGEGGGTFERDFRIIGKDKATRWARIRGSLSFESGRPVLSGTIMDVTEPHRLEEELRRSHRLESLGQLAGGVAHDFNNLLGAIMGSLELVELVSPAEAREDLWTIRHGALRARDLTRQLLAFAKQQPLEFKTVDLVAMVVQVERLLTRVVGPLIEISIVRPSSQDLHVRADASLLEQVLVNLVINARDAMPNGGRVSVIVDVYPRTVDVSLPPGDLVAVSVIDTGVGMDAETRSRAFDPFFTTKQHGTGLGLASSYGIVRQHGGDIIVDSRRDHGTRFDVVLPRVHAIADAAPAEQSARRGRGRVLVVDDEEIVRKTTVRVLKSLDYDVIAASDAASALAAVAGPDEIDILLCDIAMPDRDGPSLAREIKEVRPGLKVIFVSGYAEAPLLDMPGARFLQKPYTRQQLAALLQEP